MQRIIPAILCVVCLSLEIPSAQEPSRENGSVEGELTDSTLSNASSGISVRWSKSKSSFFATVGPSIVVEGPTMTARASNAAGNRTSSTAVGETVPNVAAIGQSWNVPGDFATVQAAINAAAIGDTILVAPGTYAEALTINKVITLEGANYRTNVSELRSNPVRLNGNVSVTGGTSVWDQGPVIRGLYINGGDPVISRSPLIVEYCYLHATGGDGLSFESSGGGIGRFNLIETSPDDTIDVDHQTKHIWIEGNILLYAGNDGLETRQHNDTIPSLVRLTFINNWVEGSRQDGIQIMDYNNNSNREYYIARNVFVGNQRAAIGIMPGDVTNEDYGAAPMPERMFLFNNTFVNNTAGLSGGANVIAVNNIFTDSDGSFLFQFKEVGGSSIIAHSLLRNQEGLVGTVNLDTATTRFGDPLLDANYQLQADSPAIDAGVATYTHNGEVVLQIPSGEYFGSAPDLGAYETQSLSVMITTTSLPDGTVGVSRSQTLNATGGTPPYTWSITEGSLPPGLSLDPATGMISGTPSTAGTYLFTAQVTDSATPAQTHTQPLSMTINNPPPTPAPMISSFSPTSGPVGTLVMISGSGFIGTTQVLFNTTAATAFTRVSDARIDATVPAGATTGKISVTNPAGTGISATDFTVIVAPTITSFTPTSGPASTSVAITGTNFSSATGVAFNSTPATAFTVNSSTQITATVPTGATTGKISVTNAAGTTFSATNFEVTAGGLNLLVNPGFELDANGDNRPDSWSSTSKFTRSSAVVLSGGFSGRHFSTSNSGYTISQNVLNLTAGSTYSFTGWANIPPTSDAFTFKFEVKWHNASGNGIRTNTIKSYTGPTGGWDQATATLVAPAGTTHASVQMKVSSLKATIYADELKFNVGP